MCVLGRSPGEGKGYPCQDSGLENSMDSPWGRKELDMTERLSLTSLDVTLEPSTVAWTRNEQQRHHSDGQAGPSSLRQPHHMAAGGKPVH